MGESWARRSISSLVSAFRGAQSDASRRLIVVRLAGAALARPAHALADGSCYEVRIEAVDIDRNVVEMIERILLVEGFERFTGVS
jgi:hypothetical protein